MMSLLTLLANSIKLLHTHQTDELYSLFIILLCLLFLSLNKVYNIGFGINIRQNILSRQWSVLENITSSANYGNSPLRDIVLILTMLPLLARNAVVQV